MTGSIIKSVSAKLFHKKSGRLFHNTRVA